MYLDSLEFLEEERDAWAPYEALAGLTDEELAVPVAAAHGWSGRQLMAHLVAWQENALAVATELAVNETSATKARSDADWDARGDAINDEIDATWAALPMTEVRERFATIPGQLRLVIGVRGFYPPARFTVDESVIWAHHRFGKR